jgi:hypothetical protein
MEGGDHADLLMGDNANQFQNDPNGGHDVMKGGGGSDDHDSDGGDDIMIGNAGGTDRIEGMMGFDWVTYYGENASVDVDLRFSILQRPDIQAVRDRFDLVEGISGGAGNDILRGMGDEADDIPDFHIGRHRMTEEHLDRIGGLRALLQPPGHVTDYALRFAVDNPLIPDADGTNNPIFGGPGSDIIQGRGGNDFLDGDLILRARLEVGGQFYDSAAALREAVFAGQVAPGDISIARDVIDLDEGGSYDTAVYGQLVADYTITDLGDVDPDGAGPLPSDGVHYYRVAHTQVGEFEESEGIDVIRNFEELRFADGCLLVENGVDPATWASCEPGGTVALDSLDPEEDQPITATLTLDAGVTVQPGTAIQYNWQIGDPGREFEPSPNDGPETTADLTNTFTPGDEDAGLLLRVIVTFTDSAGIQRFIGSETTNEIVNVNDPGVAPTLTPLTPEVGGGVVGNGFTDADGLELAEPEWFWEASPDGGTTWNEFAAGVGLSGVNITTAQEGQLIRARVVYEDDQGTEEQVISAPTNAVVAAGP